MLIFRDFSRCPSWLSCAGKPGGGAKEVEKYLEEEFGHPQKKDEIEEIGLPQMMKKLDTHKNLADGIIWTPIIYTV